MRSSARLALLCTPALVCSVAAAQPAASGFEVIRNQTVTNAPPGFVGRKTTDRETRVGNTPETFGRSGGLVMTIGGFVSECPTAIGSVAGTFEYSLVADDAETRGGVTQSRHHEVSLNVELEGHTLSDGALDAIDIRGAFTRRLHDSPPERLDIQRSFRVGAGGQPDMAALGDAVLATGDISIATAMWMASTLYTEAWQNWIRPNNCVEVAFEPPSDTRFVGPNGSTDVRVVLRTKKEHATIAEAPLSAQPVGAGTVSPRQDTSRADAPFAVTYTASANPKDGHGVYVQAEKSYAGPAYGEWHIRAAVPYEGTFTQTGQLALSGADLSGPFAASAQAYGIGFSGRSELNGRVVWTPETESTRAGSFGEVASLFYVATDGEIRVEVSGEGRSVAGRCKYEGTKTFPITGLPPDALRLVLLEVAADGRYKLWLGMISAYLQFEGQQECETRVGPRMTERVQVNNVPIALGLQEGMVTRDTIAGATPGPIAVGVDSYTGRWEFKKTADR